MAMVTKLTNQMWLMIVFFLSVFALGVVSAVLILTMLSNQWEPATVLRICGDGTPIIQRADGSVWARRSAIVSYRVDRKPEEVCE
jgi:hypothetical protein